MRDVNSVVASRSGVSLFYCVTLLRKRGNDSVHYRKNGIFDRFIFSKNTGNTTFVDIYSSASGRLKN